MEKIARNKKDMCIMCGKEKNGLEVRDDYMLNGLRWIKKNITKNPKNYRLVVCKDDFLPYRKKRNSYERKQAIYVGLGIVFLVMLIVFSNGRFLAAIFYGAIITVFLYLLAQLSYMPSVRMPSTSPSKKSKN